MVNITTLLKFFRFYIFSIFSLTKKISTIHTITFRVFSPEGGRGGGSAVQTCQNLLLGDSFGNIRLKYTYFEENKFSRNWQSRLADLFGATFFAIQKTRKEKGCAYITHDYGTAFGLALLRKRFIYIAHLQGPRVEEKHNYGEIFTNTDAWIVNFCERFVFKKAMYVCFPSEGARDYYFESKYRSLDKGTSKIGPVLYNTVFTNPQPQPVDGIFANSDVTTVLSVGSLLPAKGLDLAPAYLDKKLRLTDTKVRWILVGSGHLKDDILNKAKALELEHSNFEFIFFESLSYPQIRYLNSICDVYLMPHRVSIFDLATLEAMMESKMVILSPTGGNFDFNKENNIIFTNDDTTNIFSREVLTAYGNKNKHVYEKYFSTNIFIKSYQSVIKDLIN